MVLTHLDGARHGSPIPWSKLAKSTSALGLEASSTPTHEALRVERPVGPPPAVRASFGSCIRSSSALV